MLLFLLSFVFLFILVCPIILKFSLVLTNNLIRLRIYRFTIFEKNLSSPNLHEEKNFPKKATNNSNAPSHKKESFDFFKFYKLYINNKFKPKLKLVGNIHYSLTDSYYTAISYGAINILIPQFNHLLSYLFNLQNFNLKVFPTFKDQLLINLELDCIISTNIVQIIIIGTIFLRSRKNKRE